MAKKTISVDGAPQEEVAKKTVKKTRQTKKTESSQSTTKKSAPRTLKKKKEQQVEAPVEQETVKAVTPEVPETPKESLEVVEQKEAPKPQPEEKPQPKPQQPQQEKPQPKPQQPQQKQPEPKPIPPLPNIVINDIVELNAAPRAQICLSDQQIQTLSLEEATHRFQYLEYTLANILDYNVVISDTNIWLELLVGHTSSHSDPRVNARLQFERQLEFISKLCKHRGGRFMMMAETYEEIDRFATSQEPTNYRDADWTDEALCRNVAARLAKRLILSQQRENRLRIEGIGSESHHGSFADPAIIRRTVEMFSAGKKILLLTNDASVAIRSMGMCDDLQRWNKIDDRTWDSVYAPLRPMVMTMDDLKILDFYTRQYHFLQMAAGMSFMQDIPRIPVNRDPKPVSPVYGGPDQPKRNDLELWMEGFRPGDHHERRSDQQARQKEQQRQKEEERKRQEEQRRLQSERDRARQAEINKQKELEKQQQAEAQRKAEEQKRQQAEAQRQVEEQKRQQQAEEQKKKQAEAKRQADLKKQAEKIAQRLQEQEAQKQKNQEAQQQKEQEAKQQDKPQQQEAVIATAEPAVPVEPATPAEPAAPAEPAKEKPKRKPARRAPRAKKAKEQ